MTDEGRIGGDQGTLVKECTNRLREQITEFSESNCFVTDQPVPKVWPTGQICCTVSITDGTFPEDMFASGGHLQLAEAFKLVVSPWIRIASDRVQDDHRSMLGDDIGLLTQFKPKVLKALLLQKRDDEWVAWEPSDKNGRPIVRDQLAPSFCTKPMPAADEQFLGFQLSFAVKFDWLL